MADEKQHRADVRRFYDLEAERYADQRYGGDDASVARPYLERRRFVLEFLEGIEGHVLDVGCGPGILEPSLLERGLRVTALDLSLNMIAKARAAIAGHPRAASVSFGIGSVDAIPFGDASFDAVICVGVISYAPDADAALAEISRVLRPGGTLILQASNLLAPWEIENRLLRIPYERLVIALGRVAKERKLRLRAYVPGRMVGRLARRGLEVDSVRHYDFAVPFLRILAPGLADRAARSLFRFHASPRLGLLGTGYVVRARKATRRVS